jgi:UDP-glucuronate 4-epimerase
MEVLVTGGAGFIGSHVVERLDARGDRVTVLDNFNDFYDPAIKRGNLRGMPSVEVVEGDLRDEALVAGLLRRGFDLVVHLAAMAGVRPSIADPMLYSDVNVRGTQILLEGLKSGRTRLVFASSSSVYGANEDVPFREDADIHRPVSPYAATKRAGELVAHTFHHAHGLSVTCARIFTAYGPRQRPDLAIRKFAERMRRGDSVPVYGDGSALRDFTYVDDLVEGLVRALDRDLGFAILNFGAGRAVSVLEVVHALEEELEVKARVEWRPRQTGDVSRTWADIGAAREALGYAPQVELREGIRRFAAWLGSQA